MTYRVRGVASPPVAAGLRLAGIATDDAANNEEASRRIAELAARGDMGVLLVEQLVMEALPDPLRRALARRPLPILVPIPRAAVHPSRDAAGEYLLELLRRAVGYRVRLQ